VDDAPGRAARAEDQAPIGIGALRWLAAALALAGGAAGAQDEHGRRLGAELVVMAGDVRQIATASAPSAHQAALAARVRGALSSLPLLIRASGNAVDREELRALRAAVERRDWSAAAARLEALQKRHPLDLRGILPAPPAADRLAVGETIHRQACAGCHDNPSTDSPLPAHDLFKQVKAMPVEEFAARLLNGVRGDAVTAHRNPFSDAEIGALIAYYASGARR
jgi:mono/diheme cytochrome c family protein